MFAVIAFVFAIFSAAEAANSRIYGGAPAEDGDFPSMAYLTYRGYFQCGCVIIRETSRDFDNLKAITSESCVVSDGGFDVEDWKVFAGSVERDGRSGTQYKMMQAPSVHKKVAILTLEIEYEDTSANVEAARIATMPTSTGKLCTIVGWGYTTANAQDYADTLRYGTVPFKESEDCRRYTLLPHGICVGNEYSTVDVCEGDQGGPLYDGDGSSNLLLGIAIEIPDECGGGNPAIYADLAHEDLYGFIQYQLSLP